MRVAVFSDVHGNLFALQALLAELERQEIDQAVCLGDVAAFGPQPREALAFLREQGWPVVMGNTDAWLLDPKPHEFRDGDTERYYEVELWAAEQLTLLDKEYLRSFKPTLTIPLGQRDSMLAFHGSPRSDTEIIRPDAGETFLREIFGDRPPPVLAGGHTHVQHMRRYLSAIFLNPGSVGLPYERLPGGAGARNPPWAEYAIVENSGRALAVSFRRVRYDVRRLLEVVHDSGMPHAHWWTRDWT